MIDSGGKRFLLAHQVVTALVGTELQSFVAFLASMCPDIVFQEVVASKDVLQRLHRLLISRPIPTQVSVSDSAELIVTGRLSEQTYKSMKKTLKNHNLILARYDDVSRHLKELDVSQIKQREHSLCASNPFSPPYDCLCAAVALNDSIQRLFSVQCIFQGLVFPTLEEQRTLFKY